MRQVSWVPSPIEQAVFEPKTVGDYRVGQLVAKYLETVPIPAGTYSAEDYLADLRTGPNLVAHAQYLGTIGPPQLAVFWGLGPGWTMDCNPSGPDSPRTVANTD